MSTTMFDNARTVKLDQEQFDKLVELLTPGYEASKHFMAHLAAQRATAEPVDETGDNHTELPPKPSPVGD